MMVNVRIAQANNSPTQKLWGAVIPSVQGDAAIFYGPSTKLGGSVYRKPRVTAVDMYHKKLGGEYAEIFSAQFDTDVPLDEVAKQILRSLQVGNFNMVLKKLQFKDPIPDYVSDPVPVPPKNPKPDIATSLRQIPYGFDWTF